MRSMQRRLLCSIVTAPCPPMRLQRHGQRCLMPFTIVLTVLPQGFRPLANITSSAHFDAGHPAGLYLHYKPRQETAGREAIYAEKAQPCQEYERSPCQPATPCQSGDRGGHTHPGAISPRRQGGLPTTTCHLVGVRKRHDSQQ